MAPGVRARINVFNRGPPCWMQAAVLFKSFFRNKHPLEATQILDHGSNLVARTPGPSPERSIFTIQMEELPFFLGHGGRYLGRM